MGDISRIISAAAAAIAVTFFEEQSKCYYEQSFGSQNKRKRLNRAITDYRKFDIQLILNLDVYRY